MGDAAGAAHGGVLRDDEPRDEGRAKPRLVDAMAILSEYRDEFVLAKPPRIVQRVLFTCLAPLGKKALAPL